MYQASPDVAIGSSYSTQLREVLIRLSGLIFFVSVRGIRRPTRKPTPRISSPRGAFAIPDVLRVSIKNGPGVSLEGTTSGATPT